MSFPNITPGTVAACTCDADNAQVEIVGQGTFPATVSGQMVVTTGHEIQQDGLATIPLAITTHATSGDLGDIGTIAVNHDANRTPPLSRLQELTPGTGFPAMQEMYVNILVTSSAMPGVTLRSVSYGTLRNGSQDSFPPANANYVLQAPIDLEDVENPGAVVARIVSYTAHINRS